MLRLLAGRQVAFRTVRHEFMVRVNDLPLHCPRLHAGRSAHGMIPGPPGFHPDLESSPPRSSPCAISPPLGDKSRAHLEFDPRHKAIRLRVAPNVSPWQLIQIAEAAILSSSSPRWHG